jgi:hypothetical protein
VNSLSHVQNAQGRMYGALARLQKAERERASAQSHQYYAFHRFRVYFRNLFTFRIISRELRNVGSEIHT